MAGTVVRRRGTKSAVQKKKIAPVRRAKAIRANQPSGAVIVLSGATALRRQKAAEVLAGELQLDLASVDLSAVVSKRRSRMSGRGDRDTAERIHGRPGARRIPRGSTE